MNFDTLDSKTTAHMLSTGSLNCSLNFRYDPRWMLDILRKKYRETEGEPGASFESDMGFLISMFVTGGTNLTRMCKTFSDKDKCIANRLKDKYEITDGENVGKYTVTLSKIATCFPIDVVRGFGKSGARVLYKPGEVPGWTGEHRSIFLACCFPWKTNNVLPGLLAWVLKLQQGLQDVLGRGARFSWDEELHFLKARHTTNIVHESVRVAFLQEIGCMTASGDATDKLVRLHNEGFKFLEAQETHVLNLYKQTFYIKCEYWVEHQL